MDRQHCRKKGLERQFGYAGEVRLKNHAQRPQLQSGYSTQGGADGYACGIRGVAGDWPVDERIGDKAGENAEVENIAAQRQKSAIGEEHGLDGEHRGDGEKGRTGAEQDGKDHSSAQVAGGAGGRDGEIDHLGGEDEGAEDSHQGDLAVVEVLLDLSCADGDAGSGGSPHGATDGGGE